MDLNNDHTTKTDVFRAANRMAARELDGFDRAIKILKKQKEKKTSCV